MKKFLYLLTAICLIGVNYGISLTAAPDSAIVKKVTNTQSVKQTVAQAAALAVEPLNLVQNPKIYLNKTVTFAGEFVSFSSLGLDYKPAFRDGTKYIGVLMRRPDVKEHTIPLSELKMFMTREMAEKLIDIEAGDMFKLTGTVFSNALGDPWLEIKDFTITSTKAKKEDKEIKEKTTKTDDKSKQEQKKK